MKTSRDAVVARNLGITGSPAPDSLAVAPASQLSPGFGSELRTLARKSTNAYLGQPHDFLSGALGKAGLLSAKR